MSAAHTATPWRAECWTCHAPTTILVNDPKAGVTGKRIVAECESEGDTAFIVRACNAHDDLVKIAQEVTALLPLGHPLKDAALKALTSVGAA